MLPLIIASLLALVLSGFFTAVELSLFTLGESRIRTLLDEGFRGARDLVQVRADPEHALVLLRTGAAAADVVAIVLAVAAASRVGGLSAILVAATVATLLLLLVGRLVPIRLAGRSGLRLALFAAPAIRPLTRVLDPVLSMLEAVVHAVPPRTGTQPGSLTESEIRQLLAVGDMRERIEEHERQLIERAFRLDETKAWDIMTPRVDMFAWVDSLALAEIAPQLASTPFSRVPVYGESVDDITGVLYLRDAYQALVSGQRDVAVGDLAREPLIVPGSVPLTTLLRDFQTRRIHLAIVVDEYGGTDGLVTLEDVLEELVGEIVDETDIAKEPIRRVSRGEIIVRGDADLREINHVFNAAFPQLEHRSLNGFLLEELGRVPERGEEVVRDGIRIDVLKATETQVLRARLRRLAPAAETLSGTEAEGTRHRTLPDRSAPEPPPADDAASARPRPVD